MGLKLNNMHIYKGDAQEIKSILSDEYTVLNISPGWVTVLGDTGGGMDMTPEYIDFMMDLSKQINQPILYFGYFEEMILGTSLVKNGDMPASFGLMLFEQDQIEELEMYLDEFEIDKSLLPRLEKTLTCDDYYLASEMLEEFFGVALLIDINFIENGTEEFVRRRDDKIYREYIKQE